MDFFQAQDNARRYSSLLVFLFLAAVVLIVAVVYVVVVVLFGSTDAASAPGTIEWWQPQLLAGVAACTVGVIAIGSLTKSIALRGGGGVVAQSVGGIRVDPGTTVAAERRLLNVVEEMAIASGVRVPEVYILPEEGINAFAAGYSPDDAAVAVTRGTLDTLGRDELQGVVAHEFSHILNGDMRLNIRLIGLLFGILLLAILGRGIFHSLRFARLGGRRGRGGGGGAVLALIVLGLALILIGYIGVFFGRMIQSAVSRQREFLADASAVQFTRNPQGIAGALKKIGSFVAGSRVHNTHATETSHLFFANALQGSAFNLFATHPPLEERIHAIDPSFDGRFPAVTAASSRVEATPSATAERSRTPPPLPFPLGPDAFLAAVAGAGERQPERGAAIINSLPSFLLSAAREPSRARAVIVALLATIEDASINTRQVRALADRLLPDELQTSTEAMPLITGLSLDQKFALLDLALPTVGSLSGTQIQSLLEAIDEMILADFRVTPFEFALKHIVTRYLRTSGRVTDTPRAGPRTRRPMSGDVAAIIGMIARAGAADLIAAEQAYAIGARAFRLDSERLDPDDKRSLPQLASSLQRLDQIAPDQKRQLLAALAAAASADGVLQPDEVALMRAFAAALNCPAPVLN